MLDFKHELERSGAVIIATGGRAKIYRGRVVLLIDQRCGSTTEGFASVVKETRAATLIGRRTAGAMLSSVEAPIVDGWTLAYPMRISVRREVYEWKVEGSNQTL